MRFSGGQVGFYRLKTRSKTANVAEVDGEKCEGGVKTLRVDTGRAVRPGDICGPLPRGDSEAGVGVAIFKNNFE